tara:strand:- start:449 stop:988 length:540 start_codon:yes stop_codon:yes gene_type:complete
MKNDLKKTLTSLQQVFKGIAGQYVGQQHKIDDAVQMLYEMFLTMNQETLNRIFEKDGRDGLIRYAGVTLRRYFTANKNKYYYTYRKYYEKLKNEDVSNYEYIQNQNTTQDEIQKWEYFEKIDIELDKMYWYDREVYRLYYDVEKNETLDTLSKKTGISRNSLFNTIDNVRKVLKKVLDE